jgi:multidrug efflux pump subunit AcrA (membrane-fusion protein)
MVGALAQEDATRAGTRFFPVTVTLLQADPRLRTGMTARVEIEVTSIAHALVVPIQALVREQGVTRCYVVTRSGTVRRDVDIAARNDLVAAIRTGLRVGETVLIPDPARSEPANRERN